MESERAQRTVDQIHGAMDLSPIPPPRLLRGLGRQCSLWEWRTPGAQEVRRAGSEGTAGGVPGAALQTKRVLDGELPHQAQIEEECRGCRWVYGLHFNRVPYMW
ncbi:hypothetical protein NDU88_004139 [Pleurodeles waltl]|uniref:Uncharacterized protein n=1 Tax=Pleurodeles waltl TaxID=8319 RepID=A0AAV7NK86_PLEWA|nr:hypothetical protein NDU88_004139 [Pleurodeles waltl]